jgi:hypothetical protein
MRFSASKPAARLSVAEAIGARCSGLPVTRFCGSRPRPSDPVGHVVTAASRRRPFQCLKNPTTHRSRKSRSS